MSHPTVKTRLGPYTMTREQTIAFSVVRVRREMVEHHGAKWEKGDLTHIEHRRPPYARPTVGPWCVWVASFNVEGEEYGFSEKVSNV